MYGMCLLYDIGGVCLLCDIGAVEPLCIGAVEPLNTLC